MDQRRHLAVDSSKGHNHRSKGDRGATTRSSAQMTSVPQMENSECLSRDFSDVFYSTWLPSKLPCSSKESTDDHFTSQDFPIKLDGTTFNIFNGTYSVTLLHLSRCNGILISVKWCAMKCHPICAMVAFDSSESFIRSAVEECIYNLENFKRTPSNGERHPISPCSLNYLANHYVVVLDKINENYPDAIYWCYLCDYHMADIKHVRSHFDTKRHCCGEQHVSERKELVKKVPKMSANQLEAINTLMNRIAHGSDENVRGPIWKRYLELSRAMEDLFHRIVFREMDVDGRVQVYGSVIAKTAIDNSDLNLSIDIPKVACDDAIETMELITQLLNKASDSLNAIFAPDSSMFVTLTMSNVNVRIAWRCESGVKLGRLLSVYAEVRPQYADLCRVVRKWAKVSGISSLDNGQSGLSNYGFDLMVLYFLQQIDLLPCLHEMRPLMSHERKTDPMIDDLFENRDLYEKDIRTIIAKFGRPDAVWNLGQLYVDFLRFYATRAHHNEVIQVYTKKLVTKDRTHWCRKLLQISDPFRNDNVVTFTKAYQSYFFNCFLKSYLYFVIPQTVEGPLIDVKLYQESDESHRKKNSARKSAKQKRTKQPAACATTTNQKSTSASSGFLWGQDICDDEYAAAADAIVEEEEFKAEIRRKILEDLMETSSVNNILLKDLNSENVEFDSICAYSRRTMNRIRRSNPIRIDMQVHEILERMGLARRPFKNKDKEVDRMEHFRRQKIRHEEKRRQMRAKIEEEESLELLIRSLLVFDTMEKPSSNGKHCKLEPRRNALQKVDENADICIQQVNGVSEFTRNIEDNEVPIAGMEWKNTESRICYDDFSISFTDFDVNNYGKKVNDLRTDQFMYTFEKSENFNNGYMPQVVCVICESDSHWSDKCPMMNLPVVEDIPDTKKEFEWMELDSVIMGFHERNRVKPELLDNIGRFVERMRLHLERELQKHVRLSLFGSLLSGFGAAYSDIDICFRFQEDVQPLEMDGVGIVREIALSLDNMKDVDKVYAITAAKVPIVKFTWKELKVQGDISYYNVLALCNTEMLKKYCQWDNRVAPLGVWVKRWAKSCDICDASRGSLSSYAFTVLVIHYLQNCVPAVVPRLQEDFRDNQTVPVLVENCNVYFHRDVIDRWSENRMSVGKLFTGFLDYYARFDFESKVVQIRRKKPLLKCEKMWHRPICIEDPFDLFHNLGSGISKKMYVFIIQNIHNSRKHFLLSDIRNNFLKVKGVLLEEEMPYHLCEAYGNLLLKTCQMGPAPSNRQCRKCHSTGHFSENCQKGLAQRSLHQNESKSGKSHTGSDNGTSQKHVFGTQSHVAVGGRALHRVKQTRF